MLCHTTQHSYVKCHQNSPESGNREADGPDKDKRTTASEGEYLLLFIPEWCLLTAHNPQLAEAQPVLQAEGGATAAKGSSRNSLLGCLLRATMGTISGRVISPRRSLGNEGPEAQMAEINNSHCCEDTLTGTAVVSELWHVSLFFPSILPFTLALVS